MPTERGVYERVVYERDGAGATVGPPLWPYKPGEVTIRRNGYGHYSVMFDGKQVATLCGSSDFLCGPLAAALADYARCRNVVDSLARLDTERAAVLRDLPPLPTGDRFSAELTGLDPERPPAEPDPCPAAEMDALDRRLLAWGTGNQIWSHPIGGAA